MARTRRPSARGTRNSSGILSGVTWATNPSGTTIDQYGIQNQYGYLISNAVDAKLCVSGVSAWSGDTVTLVTGLTSISSIMTSVYSTSTVSQALFVVTSNINNNPGCASAAIQFSLAGLGATTPYGAAGQATGCSIAFIAFGT